MATDYPELRWAVHTLIPEGFTVLGGGPKIGKSTLVLQLSISIALGQPFLGNDCEQGDVLYIDLENGERLTQKRLLSLGCDKCQSQLERLVFIENAPPVSEELFNLLRSWVERSQDPRLIVIDVLSRVKPPTSKGGNAYETDYPIYASLQDFAQKYNITLIGLHHKRKGSDDDPLEALSGSMALPAAAHTSMFLSASGTGRSLAIRGRETEEEEIALSFKDGQFEALGTVDDMFRSEERKKILAALIQADQGMSPKEIAVMTGMKSQNITVLLRKMVQAGEVIKLRRGLYSHPDNVPKAA